MLVYSCWKKELSCRDERSEDPSSSLFGVDRSASRVFIGLFDNIVREIYKNEKRDRERRVKCEM